MLFGHGSYIGAAAAASVVALLAAFLAGRHVERHAKASARVVGPAEEQSDAGRGDANPCSIEVASRLYDSINAKFYLAQMRAAVASLESMGLELVSRHATDEEVSIPPDAMKHLSEEIYRVRFYQLTPLATNEFKTALKVAVEDGFAVSFTEELLAAWREAGFVVRTSVRR